MLIPQSRKFKNDPKKKKKRRKFRSIRKPFRLPPSLGRKQPKRNVHENPEIAGQPEPK